MQVAYLAQYGASNKEIARTLGVALDTIRTYKKQIGKISREFDKDVFGLPLSYAARVEALQKIAARAQRRFQFGSTSKKEDI